MALFPQIMELLQQNDMIDDTLVVCGGIIPDIDIPELSKIGIKGIFGPGTDTDEIVDFINKNLKRPL
jgi:methylmalonyl-CoA mutase C-terminal domain/subunit